MNEPSPWLQTSPFGRRLTVFLGGGIIYSLIEVGRIGGFTQCQ